MQRTYKVALYTWSFTRGAPAPHRAQYHTSELKRLETAGSANYSTHLSNPTLAEKYTSSRTMAYNKPYSLQL